MSRVIASFLVALGLAVALLASERFVMAQAGPYGTLMGVAGGGVAAGGTVTGGQLIVNFDPAGTATNQASLFINMPSGAAATDKALAIKTNDTTDRFSVDNSGAVAGQTVTLNGGGGTTAPMDITAATGSGNDYTLKMQAADASGLWATFYFQTAPTLHLISGVISGYQASDSGMVAGLRLKGGRDSGTISSPSLSSVSTVPFVQFENGSTAASRWYASGRIANLRVAPTSLSGDVNDYAGCTGYDVCNVNGGAANRNMNGFTKNSNDTTLSESFKLCNVGTTNNLVLTHDNAGSTAANRLYLSAATSKTLVPNSCVTLLYVDDVDRWFLIGGPT